MRHCTPSTALWLESNAIETEIARSPRGTIFRDIIMPEHISLLALRQTTAGIWGNQFHMACYNAHGMTGDRMAAVVPSALKDFSFRNATRCGETQAYICGADT